MGNSRASAGQGPRRRRDTRRRVRRRYILPDTWVYCTSRTRQAKYDFSAFDAADTARAWGLVVVAARRYGVDVGAWVLMGNHLHALLRAARSQAISLFMQYVKAGLARLVHGKHGTTGSVWAGPFKHSNLCDTAAARAALVYTLRHGLKERLVADPARWYLPNCAEALRGGGRVVGMARARADEAGQPRFRRVKGRLTPVGDYVSHSGRLDFAAWRADMNQLIDGLILDEVIVRAAEGEAFASAVAEGRASPAGPGVPAPGDLVPIIRDHMFVPKAPKTSGIVRCFVARGPDARACLARAYEARREAIAQSEAVMLALAQGTAPVPPTQPVGCQWPPALSAALDEPYVVETFAEIVHPAAMVASPRQSGAG